MKRTPRSVAAATLTLLATAPAVSHHAFAPVYDINRTVSVEGTVTEFRLVNPHASMTLDVADDDGNLVEWTVDFDGRVNLAVGGWTDDTIMAGETVTVTGNPTHADTPRMFFIKLIREDGSELLRPLFERFDLIDQQRRQRSAPQD